MRKSVRLALLVVLAGCGGGGGGGGGNPSQSNSQSPTFGGLTGTLSASASALPANGARAVPTFESIGLYWKPPTNPGDGCPVIFRRVGDSNWRQGLDMWYDPNNGECRGSLVLLDPGTSYEIQFGITGQAASAGLMASTWSEQFPVAQTITLSAGTRTTPLAITQGGSPSGYVVYQADPNSGTTIDVQGNSTNNVTIAAPYVILRGFTLKNAQADAINLLNGTHDVVIEGNDISGWGRYSSDNSASGGWLIGVDMDAGVRCESVANLERVVVQRNKIHDPRYGAQSWDWGHPRGPQGITFNYCGGNNVIRYNEITSSDFRHYYNDGIGGSDNYTTTGFPNYDTDIYGNIVQGVMDDALEIEGGDKNVRIWGNYITQAGTGIASTIDSIGPLYIFRNVYDQSRLRYLLSTDQDDRGPFFKAGTDTSVGNGRRYVFHNTSLQAPNPSGSFPLGAGSGLHGPGGNPLTNTISRNNIYWIWKSGWDSVDQLSGGFGNDVDYDLYNGTINANAGAEAHGLKVTAPTFASGNGSGMSGMYQLAPGTPGYGAGVRISNFNDMYSTPDIGAHQSGTAAMRFGVSAGL
jgi:Right handed beta helix region